MKAGTEMKRGFIVSVKGYEGDAKLYVVEEDSLGFFFRGIATRLENIPENVLLLKNAYKTFHRTFVLTSNWVEVKSVIEICGEVN